MFSKILYFFHTFKNCLGFQKMFELLENLFTNFKRIHVSQNIHFLENCSCSKLEKMFKSATAVSFESIAVLQL